MGEAKRRKKLDPSYGKPSLRVILNEEIELPLDLQQCRQSLLKEGKIYKTGMVFVNEKNYPALFLPYTQKHVGRIKLYAHTLFSRTNSPELSQKLIDLISQQVCHQLIQDNLLTIPHL